MKLKKKEIQKFKSNHAFVDHIIGSSDGVMIPIVIPGKNGDKRKNKQHEYNEVKTTVTWKNGDVKPIVDALMGSPGEVGKQILYCVEAAGRKNHTKIHFVADGALWIADQVEKIFGSDASFLIDFYHLSQYLAEAAGCCNPSDKGLWRRSMQQLMKEGKISLVLKELLSHMHELEEADDHECLAKKCYNYMAKRLNQFDYKGAIEQGLPIGSGKVESTHKTLIQSRLKKAGAWWKKENAESMIALRVIRANGFFDQYWTDYPMSYSAKSVTNGSLGEIQHF